jgi:multicomponent K+:H+ antiporter subunit A
MSLFALAGGSAIYAFLYFRRGGALQAIHLGQRFDGKRNFELIVVSLIGAAGRVVRALYSRRLQPQLVVLVGAIVAITGTAAVQEVTLSDARTPSPLNPAFAILWAVGAACAIGAAINAKFHRLAALVMAGGAGIVICLTYAWFSAPDVALTQITVEIVTLVLLLLGLRWLPKRIEALDRDRETPRARARRARDFVIAIVAGAGMASLAYAMLTRPSILSRVRHPGRNHGRGHRRTHRLQAPAAIPSGSGEHLGCPRRSPQRRSRGAPGGPGRAPQRLHESAGRARTPDPAAGRRDLHILPAARP